MALARKLIDAYHDSHPFVRLAAIITAIAVITVGFVALSSVTPQWLTDSVNQLAEVGLIVIAIPAGLFFVVFFIGFTFWNQSPAGKSVGILGVMLVTLLIVNALSLTLGTEYPGREYIRLVSYWGLAIALIYLSVVVVHLNVLGLIRRRDARREAEAELDAPDLADAAGADRTVG